MTFVLTLKVGDGIVFAADSTSTMRAQDIDQHLFDANYYRNANKIFNLVKTLPVAVCTYGLGSIGNHSIEFTLKELRRRLSGQDSTRPEWKVNPNNYTIEQIVERFCEYVIDERYEPYFKENGYTRASLGFILAGIATDNTIGQMFAINTDGGEKGWVKNEVSDIKTLGHWYVAGQPEPVIRLLTGVSGLAKSALTEKFDLNDDAANAMIAAIQDAVSQPLVQSLMPIQDAIDLAEFLVDVAVKWARFAPMGETIGGNIDIATLTKYEGFKWVKRKHYYSDRFNPRTYTIDEEEVVDAEA